MRAAPRNYQSIDASAKRHAATTHRSSDYSRGDSSENALTVPATLPTIHTLARSGPACVCGGGCPRCENGEFIRAKLKIGTPGDSYEQEADRVADAVMRAPEPAIALKPT
jgi:hypothetical protein